MDATLTSDLLTHAGPLLLFLWRLERAQAQMSAIVSDLKDLVADHGSRLARLEDEQTK